MLMAKAPGQLWAMAMRSRNSSFVSHECFLTTSASMIGIMAYPPPRVNAPILKNTLNKIIGSEKTKEFLKNLGFWIMVCLIYLISI